MQIAVSTTDREPAYVHRTLDTMLSRARKHRHALHIRLVVCGSDASYLDRWANEERVTIDTMSGRRAGRMRRMVVKRRIFMNTVRCLVHASKDEPLIYCQDDVELASDWVTRLQVALRHVPPYLATVLKTDPDRYLLALYASYPFVTRPVTQYPTQMFYGNQCLLISKAAHPELAEAMAQASGSVTEPDDIFFKNWCMKQNVPILCAVPNLAQHVGGDSTLMSDFHTSPTYEG